jgi:hypothetical protein
MVATFGFGNLQRLTNEAHLHITAVAATLMILRGIVVFLQWHSIKLRFIPFHCVATAHFRRHGLGTSSITPEQKDLIMTKLYLTITITAILVTQVSLAQPTLPSNLRYQIVEVEKIQLSEDSLTFVDLKPVGDNHNHLLLDTQTGETWILCFIWNSSGLAQGPAFVRTVAWRRIGFDINDSKLIKERLPLAKTPLGR